MAELSCTLQKEGSFQQLEACGLHTVGEQLHLKELLQKFLLSPRVDDIKSPPF